MRPGPGWALSLPRGQRCSLAIASSVAAARRLPSAGPYSPHNRHPTRDVDLSRHQQEFPGSRPIPALPLTCGHHGRVSAPWAFPRASYPTDQEPATHVAVGTGRTQTHSYVFDIRRTSLTSSLITCDLVSQQGRSLPRPQRSLFDTQNFAEITHPDYPGERLICCRNPALADHRAHTRQELLTATDIELTTIAARVNNGKLHGADDIDVTVGKIINKYKMAKHVTLDITDNTFHYHRDQPQIDTEAGLDGIYVIRTSRDTESLDTPGVITTHKNLAPIERDFRLITVDDLDLRPIYHHLSERVRSHVFLGMLAAYLTWHLRKALAPLTYTDEPLPHRTDPVSPTQRSPSTTTKDKNKQTPHGLPLRSFHDLLEHLSKLNRQTINFTDQRIEKITNPTPTQRRVFELIGVPIPLTLANT